MSIRKLMSKLRKNCWEDLGWVRGEQLRDKEGNQSHTFLARHSSDPPDKFGYILKTLKRQDSIDRRAMFCSETTAMKNLDHPGVLPVNATNSENFKDAVELYLITPKAPGEDLETIVSQNLGFEDAIRITIGVLEILKHCHSRGVVHRDIKPCHVFVEPNCLESPTLIDFGLAYVEESRPKDAETLPGQGRGNRFLIGPEHLPGVSITNRSSSTDICQCVGLLFFAIAKEFPGVLRDENNLKPHRRSAQSISVSSLEWKNQLLSSIFDKAFEWHPDKRWVDPDSLKARLTQLLEDQLSPDEQLELKVAKTIELSQIASKFDDLSVAKKMSTALLNEASDVLKIISAGMKSYIQVNTPERAQMPEGFLPGGNDLVSFVIDFRLKHKSYGKTVRLTSTLENKRFVAILSPYNGNSSIFPGNKSVQLGSGELGDFSCISVIRSELENKILTFVQELLEE